MLGYEQPTLLGRKIEVTWNAVVLIGPRPASSLSISGCVWIQSIRHLYVVYMEVDETSFVDELFHAF